MRGWPIANANGCFKDECSRRSNKDNNTGLMACCGSCDLNVWPSLAEHLASVLSCDGIPDNKADARVLEDMPPLTIIPQHHDPRRDIRALPRGNDRVLGIEGKSIPSQFKAPEKQYFPVV